MKLPSITTTLLLVALLGAMLPVQADEKDDIIARCRSTMGEYGAAMVKYCADRDIQSLNALNTYPESATPFIQRCYRVMGEYGWAMVKYCADRDIEADEALKGY